MLTDTRNGTDFYHGQRVRFVNNAARNKAPITLQNHYSQDLIALLLGTDNPTHTTDLGH